MNPSKPSDPHPGALARAHLRRREAEDLDARSASAGTDELIGQLDGLADRELREHVAVFEAIHRSLAERLDDTEA